MQYARKLLASVTILSLVVPLLVYAYADINQNFAEIEQFYGIPSGILAKFAHIESGGNPNARAKCGGCSASGMFQFTTDTWKQMTKQMYGSVIDPNKRFDPIISAKVTAYSIAQTRDQIGGLIQQAGVDQTVGLYLGHFLGVAGAKKFLSTYIQNPNANASAIFPKEARSNPSIFNGRSLMQIYNLLAQRLGQAGATVSVAGNFEDQNGVSLAQSPYDLRFSDYQPGVAAPTSDPERTYQTDYSTWPSASGSSAPSGSYAPSNPTTQTPYQTAPTVQPIPQISYASSSPLTFITPQTLFQSDTIQTAQESTQSNTQDTTADVTISAFDRLNDIAYGTSTTAATTTATTTAVITPIITSSAQGLIPTTIQPSDVASPYNYSGVPQTTFGNGNAPTSTQSPISFLQTFVSILQGTQTLLERLAALLQRETL